MWLAAGVRTAAMFGCIAAPDSAAPQPATVEAPRAEVRHDIVIDGAIDGADALKDELGLRTTARAIQVARPGWEAPEASFVWVSVAAVQDTARIQLIVSDGRLFRRSVEATPSQRARVVAGAIANMVDAVENNRLAPEETGVALPEPAPDPDVTPEPAPVEVEPEAPVEPPPPPAEPAPVPANAWLAAVARGALSVGVGAPTAVAGLTGIGGGLGARWSHRTGAVVTADVRATGWRSFGLQVTRTRLAIAGGYAWRRERVELSGVLGPTVEFPRISETLSTPSGTPRGSNVLLGGRLMLRPAVMVAARPGFELLLGLEAELAAAFEARTPAGAIQIYRRTPGGVEPIARAGGLELSAAVAIEARFALPKPR